MNTNLNNAEVTNATASDASEMIEGTTWSWADAVDMAAEIQRENRLFGRRNRSPRRNRSGKMSDRAAAAFKKLTGWTIEDAAAMAKECMRDDRLFGRRSCARA